MNDYRQQVLTFSIASTAIFAYVLGLALPAQVAAVTGGLLGIMATRSFDQVQNKFRTDVDRILQPNKPTTAILIGTGVFALLSIVTFAGVMSPVMAAPLGLLLAAALAGKIFK